MYKENRNMKILGLDYLVLAADDLDACTKCLDDYGLTPIERSASGATYEALDGTGVILRKPSDASLPNAIAPDPNMREMRYGVADTATLDAIGAELSKDRNVKLIDGVLRSTDDDGYPIGFQVSVRRKFEVPHCGGNVPGQVPGRPVNQTAVRVGYDARPMACSLSHAVTFTRDKVRAEKFYTRRLGFRLSDAFTDLGPFLRPAGTQEHHTLFMIEAPLVGLQHFTFHFADPNAYFKAGWQFASKGHKSFWGPGRHVLGSNYFWYFKSPFGGLIEFDADMDLHDDSWKPRFVPATEDTSQSFLLQYTEKWMPRGPN
jgi:catechol 2,3-dioxygenase-like lactoylglutathione lyase family enzyme